MDAPPGIPAMNTEWLVRTRQRLERRAPARLGPAVFQRAEQELGAPVQGERERTPASWLCSIDVRADS